MTDRRPIGWYLGLILIAVVATTTAIVLTWIASDMQIRVNEFYSSNTGGLFDDSDYREWDTLSMNSYTLLSLVAPLLIGSGTALVAMLAVLAYRWEQRRVLGQRDEEEATEASRV
jgi:hypothetical protein